MAYYLETNRNVKIVRSEGYNYSFDKRTGLFARWGKTINHDPEFSPFGPELADIEISTICHGPSGIPCQFCYKSNSPKGKNMSLETFKLIFNKLPLTVTQIAFGIGDIDSNPDLLDIMRYSRSYGVIPNITINGRGITDEWVKELSEVCGAVAVSNYHPDLCYGTVQKLTRASKKVTATLKQVNIHQLLSLNTLDTCHELLNHITYDKRLEDLNAAVFLLLKPKGKRNNYQVLRDFQTYKNLIDTALDKNLPIGFDSCGASSFIRAIQGRPHQNILETLAEPCESTRFSIYINTEGLVFPCSFTEDQEKPIDIKKVNNFLKEIWFSDEFESFRGRLRDSCDENGCQRCPAYNLEME